jgi:hypothetical protein
MERTVITETEEQYEKARLLAVRLIEEILPGEIHSVEEQIISMQAVVMVYETMLLSAHRNLNENGEQG